MSYERGKKLYRDGRAFAACINADERAGWVRAQYETKRERERIERLDEDPDWWLEEMAS